MNEEKILNFDIIDYLEGQEMSHKGPNQRGWITLEECPFCSKKNKAYVMIEQDNSFDGLPLGFFNCYSCNKKGGFEAVLVEIEGISFKKAKERLYGKGKFNPDAQDFSFSQRDNDTKDDFGSVHDVVKSLREVSLPTGCRPVYEHNETDRREAVKYLTNRGLSEESIKLLEIELIPDMNWVTALDKALELMEVSEEKREDIKVAHKALSQNNGNPPESMTPEQYDFIQKVISVRNEIKRFSGRVIFPSKLGTKILGFIARAYTKEFYGPKVLNSTGPLTSVALTNFNNVQNSEEIIFVEGIFDAVSTGLARSIPLLGKSLSKKQGRFKLLELLKAQKAIVFGDPGARDELPGMVNTLLLHFKEVRVVIVPNYLAKRPASKEDWQIFYRLGGEKLENGELELSPNAIRAFKMVKKVLTNNPHYLKSKYMKLETLKSLEKRYGKLSENQKNKVFNVLRIFKKKELLSIATSSYGDFFSELGLKDANDLGASYCARLISEAKVFNHLSDVEGADD